MNVEVPDSQVPTVVDALCVQLKTNFQLNVRYHCAVSLGRFENEAQKAIPALISAIKDMKSWEVRQAACYSLTRMYHYPSDFKGDKIYPDLRTYQALVSALSDPASKVRMEALQGLLGFGTTSDRAMRKALLDGLLTLQNDREKAITVWAYVGLMLNDDTGVNDIYMNALTRMLQGGDVPTKIQAVYAFTLLIREVRSPTMKKKLLDIVAIIKDPSNDPALISTACWALVNISQKLGISDDAIKAVETVSKDKKAEEWLQYSAKNAHTQLTKLPEKPAKPVEVAKPIRP